MHAHPFSKNISHLQFDFSTKNTLIIDIANAFKFIVDDIETGKLIVEGKYLYDSESDFIRDRRKYSYEGIAMISIVINDDLTIDKNIQLSFI